MSVTDLGFIHSAEPKMTCLRSVQFVLTTTKKNAMMTQESE